MIAPVDGSGSWPAWMQMVRKRASVGSFTIDLSRYMSARHRRAVHSVIIDVHANGAVHECRRPAAGAGDCAAAGADPLDVRARPAAAHVARPRSSSSPRRSSSSSRCCGSLGELPAFVAGRRAAPPRSALVVSARLLRLAAVRAGEAAAAVARPPQADPLLHLHRRRPGAADRRSSSCSAACCSS